MGINKKLSAVEQQYEHFAHNYEVIYGRLTYIVSTLRDLSAKLDEQKVKTICNRIVSVRNWLSFFLLCCIFALLLCSCFVSGRTIHVSTPRINIEADTATAFSLPYSSNGNWK